MTYTGYVYDIHNYVMATITVISPQDQEIDLIKEIIREKSIEFGYDQPTLAIRLNPKWGCRGGLKKLKHSHAKAHVITLF